MDLELVVGATLIVFMYAISGVLFWRYERPALTRQVNLFLFTLWLAQLILFGFHVYISEDRIAEPIILAAKQLGDWSLYSDGKGSIPTYFAFVQLALLSALCGWLSFQMRRQREAVIWLIMSVGLAIISLDELLQLHESYRWLVYLYFIAAVGAGVLFLHRFYLKPQRQLIWICVGLALSAMGGIVLDRLSPNAVCVRVTFPLVGCGNIGIVEEMSEKLGAWCVLVGSWSYMAVRSRSILS